jgi:hypothetical protein
VLLAATLSCEARPGAEGPAPTPEERLADWATLPEGSSVPVSLGFGRVLSDSAVAGLLEAHGLRPYAVFMNAAGMQSAHRRERSRASLEVLAEAREQTVAQLRTSLCAQRGRARAMLAGGDAGSDRMDPYRAVLSRFLIIQRTLPALELGAPLVYGVEAVGELEEVRAVGSDPMVSSYEPGWRGRIGGEDTVVVPQPASIDSAPELDPEVAALTPEEVEARMAQLAEDGMGVCADASRPEVEAR